jgi:hypothetical protein
MPARHFNTCATPDRMTSSRAALALATLTVVAGVATSEAGATTFLRPAPQLHAVIEPSPLPVPRLLIDAEMSPAEGRGSAGMSALPSWHADTLLDLGSPGVAKLELVGHRKAGQVAGTSGGGWASVSGLSWRSGQACIASANMESFRGRRNDVYVDFVGRRNFADVIKLVSNYHPKQYGKRPGRLSVAMPMLTEDMRFQWSRCTSGGLDNHFRDIGRALQAKGLGNAIIRLGWEANGSGFPWNIKGKVSEYKACFQRQVRVLRSVAPGLLIDWTMKKSTEGGQGAQMLYPGDQFVDIIGVNYYDGYPEATNQSEWDKAYSATYAGGPKGLGTWLSFARSRGKKLSVPEWAVWNQSGRGRDNPFFVQKMHETFRRNASSIAYESYFNCRREKHQVYPSSYNPKASSAYRQLWAQAS